MGREDRPPLGDADSTGVDSDLRFYRAFHRLDLADETYCMPNIGVVGPDGDNPSFPTDAHIPGWSGRWPSALALDAKGWAAVLWGSPRNLWRWWPTWLADGEDIDGMSRSLMDGWRREGLDGPACVDVGGGWVGVVHFTELWGFDGADINDAAGRVLEIPPEWTQWLGGSKNRHGPYCRGWLTGRHLGDVCRMAAEGVHPREACRAVVPDGVEVGNYARG